MKKKEWYLCKTPVERWMMLILAVLQIPVMETRWHNYQLMTQLDIYSPEKLELYRIDTQFDMLWAGLFAAVLLATLAADFFAKNQRQAILAWSVITIAAVLVLAAGLFVWQAGVKLWPLWALLALFMLAVGVWQLRKALRMDKTE